MKKQLILSLIACVTLVSSTEAMEQNKKKPLFYKITTLDKIFEDHKYSHYKNDDLVFIELINKKKFNEAGHLINNNLNNLVNVINNPNLNIAHFNVINSLLFYMDLLVCSVRSFDTCKQVIEFYIGIKLLIKNLIKNNSIVIKRMYEILNKPLPTDIKKDTITKIQSIKERIKEAFLN
jgi:hypothetical protein